MEQTPKRRQRKPLRLHFTADEQKTIEHTINPLYAPLDVGSPTTALPGSEAKIRVLVERLERGEDLWHPKDPDCFGKYTQRMTFNFLRGSQKDPQLIDRDTYGERIRGNGSSVEE